MWGGMTVSVDGRDERWDLIDDMRNTFSLGIHQSNKILGLVEDGVCPNLLHAIQYEHASGFAVHVKGGPDARHEWNLRSASGLCDTALARDPSLARFSEITNVPPLEKRTPDSRVEG